MTSNRQSVVFGGTVNAGAMSTGNNSTTYGTLTVGSQQDASQSQQRSTSAVLCVVAAAVERDAIIRAATEATGTAPKPTYSAHQTIHQLGRIGAADVMLAHVGQGNVTPDSAGGSAAELITAVQPDVLLLVGICYGLREERDQLGDILVATELRLIAHHRKGSQHIDRGGAVHPSARVIDRFRNATATWSGSAAVHLGQMLSESVLVDSTRYRQHLKKRYPEALGGEMEGAGIYTAAHRSGTEWGVVKAVCDWAYEKSDSHHQLAAANAAAFVMHTIRARAFDPIE